MKRILALLLLVVMVIGLVACSGGKTPTGDTPNAGTINFTVPEGGYDGSAVEIKFYRYKRKWLEFIDTLFAFAYFRLCIRTLCRERANFRLDLRKFIIYCSPNRFCRTYWDVELRTWGSLEYVLDGTDLDKICGDLTCVLEWNTKFYSFISFFALIDKICDVEYPVTI
jgi:hypothetical protein